MNSSIRSALERDIPHGVFRLIRSYVRLPPRPGGMEMHIAQLSAAQREQGVDVTNVFNSGTPTGSNVQVLPEIELSRIRPGLLRNGIFYSAAVWSRGLPRSEKLTVLHVHGDATDFIFARMLGRRVAAKVLAATVHDALAKGREWLYRQALTGYDPVFATGKADQEYLQSILQRPVYHLPSAPNNRFFVPPREAEGTRVDVVSIGSLVRKKRLDLLLQCAARLRHLRFAVLGDGPLRAELEAVCSDLGLSNVVFLGHQSVDQVLQTLASAKVFLSTAEHEGTPTSVLEAMAIGIPVVVTPSNQYDWLIKNGRNGFISPSMHVDDIVDCLMQVFRSEEEMRRMGDTNRVDARQYTWEAHASKVTALMAKRANEVR